MAKAYIDSSSPSTGYTTQYFPKKASTAFAQNSFVEIVDGFAQPGSSAGGAADKKLAGIYDAPAITSASANYASTDLIPVQTPAGYMVVRSTVSGTFAATNVGDSFDLAGPQTVNADANTNKAVTCVAYLSATEGLFVLARRLDS